MLFDLIFGEEFFTLIMYAMIFALVAFIIYVLAFKREFSRLVFSVIGVCLYVFLIFTGVVSINRLNTYYSTEGGIYGKITEIVTNEVNSDLSDSSELIFNFNNIVMTKNDDGSYSATFTVYENITLDANENYVIYVNDFPLLDVESYSNDYVIVNYSYVFLNDDLESIASDTLTIRFAFSQNYSIVTITSYADYSIISLWNTYFNKNNFNVTIKAEEVTYLNENELKTLSLMVNDEIYKSIKLTSGSTVNLSTVTEPEVTGYTFNGWILNEEDVTNSVLSINDDLVITADLTAITYTIEWKFTTEIPTNLSELPTEVTYDEWIEINLVFENSVYHSIYIENMDASTHYFDEDISNEETLDYVGTIYKLKNLRSTSGTVLISIYSKPNLYKVTLDLNGISDETGNCPSEIYYIWYGGFYLSSDLTTYLPRSISIPYNVSADFLGFYTSDGIMVISSTGSIDYDLELQEIITSDMTLYAKWEASVYKIYLETTSYNIGAWDTYIIYEKYGVGFYLDKDCENEITAFTEIPLVYGYTFKGFINNGNTIIDENGNIIVSSTYFKFNTSIFLVAEQNYVTATFIVDDEVYYETTVLSFTILEVASPEKTGYVFKGWQVGNNIIEDISTYELWQDTEFIAIFEQSNEETSTAITYTNNWSELTLSGVSSISGNLLAIWTDGTNSYYSKGSSVQYVFNSSTNTWDEMTWNGYTDITSQYVWTDGENIYYSYNSYQYVLDVESSTWLEMTWYGLISFRGDYIWTDGVNFYYSNYSTQYVLDVETSTWSKMTWTGLTSFYGMYTWTDGENIYYSYNSQQYILDIETSTWSEMTWSGLTSFMSVYIWTDGVNIYYSNYSSQYVLDVENSTWSKITWTGLTSFYGNLVWKNGNNIYYSYGTSQYQLDKEVA